MQIDMTYKDFKRFSIKWKVFRQLGAMRWLQFFLFQRILRINGHVPWPVHWSSIVTQPEKIEIDGLRPFLGFMPGMYVQAINGIKIGKNLRTGPGVKIISASHSLNGYSRHEYANPIEIGDNCWLAADVVVLPGVKLGDHVVAAAGAVITKSFSSNCLIGGVPAKIIKELPEYEK